MPIHRLLNPAKYGKGFAAMFRQGWNEIPEVIGGTFMALIGIGLSSMACYIYYSNDRDNRRYRVEYTVIRDDDPRAQLVRKD